MPESVVDMSSNDASIAVSGPPGSTIATKSISDAAVVQAYLYALEYRRVLSSLVESWPWA